MISLVNSDKLTPILLKLFLKNGIGGYLHQIHFIHPALLYSKTIWTSNEKKITSQCLWQKTDHKNPQQRTTDWIGQPLKGSCSAVKWDLSLGCRDGQCVWINQYTDHSNKNCESVNYSSHVWFFSTPWTVAHQALLSMKFSRQECWSG